MHRHRLVLIDLPRVVDVVADPRGMDFLARDVRDVCGCFTGRGLRREVAGPAAPLARLVGALW